MTQLLCLFHCLVPVDRQQLVGTPRSLSPFFVTWHVGLLLFALSMHTCAPGLRIWVFSGDVDGIVPVLGSRRWIEGLGLPLVTPWRPWRSATGQARPGAARRGAVHWDLSRSILRDLPQQQQQQRAAAAAEGSSSSSSSSTDDTTLPRLPCPRHECRSAAGEWTIATSRLSPSATLVSSPFSSTSSCIVLLLHFKPS
jgi:Serine carboxypeptidase